KRLSSHHEIVAGPVRQTKVTEEDVDAFITERFKSRRDVTCRKNLMSLHSQKAAKDPLRVLVIVDHQDAKGGGWFRLLINRCSSSVRLCHRLEGQLEFSARVSTFAER